MLAPRVREIARGVVVVDVDVRRQTGARVAPLDEVVRQKAVLGKAPLRRTLEGIDVVDPLPGEAPLAVQVLVHVGHGRRVRIDARMPRVDGGEVRAIGARQRHADARLEDPVAAHDTPARGVVHGAVQRMRQRADEQRGRVRRKDRVGVQGDHVAGRPDRLHVADDHRERVARAAPKKAVELGELAAFALPPHPDALLLVPPARAMEQIERVVRAGGVALVQRAHALDRGGHDRVVVVGGLRRRVGEIAEHREVQVCLTIGEELHLERLERFVHRVDVGKQRRDHDRRAKLLGYAALLAQVQLRENARWQEGGDELVHDVDGNVHRGEERNGQHREPRGARGRTGQHEHGGEGEHREGDERADEHDVRVPQHPSVDGFSDGGAVPHRSLQLAAPLIDQVVADVPAAHRVRLRASVAVAVRGATGELDRLVRDRDLRGMDALGQLLHDVAVGVARRERHAPVEVRRIFRQHAIHRTLPLDDRLPVHARHGTQTRDAVRGRDLRERDALRGLGGGLLGAQRIFGDPLLEPEDGGHRALRLPELVQEARDEDRIERRRAADELVQRFGERRVVRVAGALYAGGPPVRRLHLLESLEGAEGHAANVLDESQPQHGGHRPQLTDDERRDLLKGAEKELDVPFVDATFGVRDEGDGDLVHARIAGQRADRELGQLAVIAAREALCHVADVLLDHVEVVEEPLAGRSDIDVARRRLAEACVRVDQDLPRLIQAGEERGSPARSHSDAEPLLAREDPRALREMLGAEQLPADGAGGQGVGTVRSRREETGENACGHHGMYVRRASAGASHGARQRIGPFRASRGNVARRRETGDGHGLGGEDHRGDQPGRGAVPAEVPAILSGRLRE